MNLLKRNITANSLCDYCCCETEDAIHAIWGCPEVKIVWWELSSVDLSWQKNWNFKWPKIIQCSNEQWLPPSPNQYKANSDGAIFRDSGSAGLGVVVRDSKGMVIAVLSLLKRITLPPTVEDVEALACRRAISFSIELGLQDVISEGDSEIVLKHLVLDSPCLVAFGHIIEKCDQRQPQA
nr:hypothetical protein CFP56_65660 [Quercus suber]